METTYKLYRYRDGSRIGVAQLTAEQYGLYAARAQHPQGLMCLGDLRRVAASVTLDTDVPATTTIWID